MAMKAKTAIVGGGLLGTTIAWYLAQWIDGLREAVVLCEKGEIGGGSSGRAAAVLSQVHDDLALSGMARDSLKLYSSFEGRCGRSIGFQDCGVLMISDGTGDEERARLEQREHDLVSIGIPVETVGAGAMRELVPGIRVGDDALGLWEPGGGFLDPQRAMTALSALARDQGAVMRTGTEVDEILFDGDRVVGLRTSQGDIETDEVVVTAGPYTRDLLARAGVDAPLRLLRTHQHHVARPIHLVDQGLQAAPGDLSQTWIRGFDPKAIGREVLERDLEDRFSDENEERARHPVVVDRPSGIVIRNDPARECTRVLEIGTSSAEAMSEPGEPSITAATDFAARAQQVLEERMPGYRGLETVGSETSWENHTPDSLPIVGQVPGARGLWIAEGFGKRGYEFAPSIAEGLAQLLHGKPVSAFDPERLAPERLSVRRVAPSGKGANGGAAG